MKIRLFASLANLQAASLLFFGDAIGLLNFSWQFVSYSSDNIKMVVSNFSPILFDVTF
jgi:hypothetical protein